MHTVFSFRTVRYFSWELLEEEMTEYTGALQQTILDLSEVEMQHFTWHVSKKLSIINLNQSLAYVLTIKSLNVLKQTQYHSL